MSIINHIFADRYAKAVQKQMELHAAVWLEKLPFVVDLDALRSMSLSINLLMYLFHWVCFSSVDGSVPKSKCSTENEK